jgi:hypothetical protein
MTRDRRLMVRLFLRDDNGQILPMVALMMVAFIGMTGLVVDAGHLYVAYNELQASTNAAALAAAQSLPNSNAVSVATNYSAVAGNLNAHGNLPNVSMVSGFPQASCLASLVTQNMPCVAPANANAIIVKQQAVVPTYFASLFGMSSVKLVASAAAAMRGGVIPPHNVAIVIDTTASMEDTDNSSSCNNTRISCALSGVRTLLLELSPCASSQSTCGTATNGNVANSVDRVSLFAFPNVTQATVVDDSNCSGKNPTSEVYTFPTAGASSYAPASSTATYQIVNYSSDYRASDVATVLNTTSDLALASGAKKGCAGMGAPGGEGTYLAGAIYAAQASLVAEQAANPGSQNVIIVLSDGDVGATSSALKGASTTSGTYPSTINQCQQAVTASKAATTAGTTVYTVAYGAEASGCTTDKTSITPCETMQQSASSPATFFSDFAATGGTSSCISAARPTTSLNQIFTQIGGDFTTSRLIPINTN